MLKPLHQFVTLTDNYILINTYLTLKVLDLIPSLWDKFLNYLKFSNDYFWLFENIENKCFIYIYIYRIFVRWNFKYLNTISLCFEHSTIWFSWLSHIGCLINLKKDDKSKKKKLEGMLSLISSFELDLVQNFYSITFYNEVWYWYENNESFFGWAKRPRIWILFLCSK